MYHGAVKTAVRWKTIARLARIRANRRQGQGDGDLALGFGLSLTSVPGTAGDFFSAGGGGGLSGRCLLTNAMPQAAHRPEIRTLPCPLVLLVPKQTKNPR